MPPNTAAEISEIQAVCVVSKARARRGQAFWMKALAVQKELTLTG